MIPPFQDLATLARNVCIGESTIERLVGMGQFPAPARMVGGKRIWAWRDIEAFMCQDPDREAQPGDNFHAEMQKLRASRSARHIR
jgi:predicted DNA-binding transcriptional regulator AlpA